LSRSITNGRKTKLSRRRPAPPLNYRRKVRRTVPEEIESKKSDHIFPREAWIQCPKLPTKQTRTNPSRNRWSPIRSSLLPGARRRRSPHPRRWSSSARAAPVRCPTHGASSSRRRRPATSVPWASPSLRSGTPTTGAHCTSTGNEFQLQLTRVNPFGINIPFSNFILNHRF
jgi:hypothetical protein